MNPGTQRLLPALLMCVSLSACSDTPDTPETAQAAVNESAVGASTQAAPAASTEASPIVESLILDPRFSERENAELLKHWRLYQHTGDPSYTVTVVGDTAEVERIDVEPWGQWVQTLDADAFSGKRMEWSAELSGHLTDGYGEPFQGSGLAITVTGQLHTDPPVIGPRILMTASTEPDLPLGELPPKRYRLEFEMPEGHELKLQVGMVLARGGVLRMRAPVLRVLEDTSGDSP